MGFKDENGDKLINDEQKIRIALSTRAHTIMKNDMAAFSESKETAFINTVFENYRETAKSSINLYLKQRREELDGLFATTNLSDTSKEVAIDQLLQFEKKQIKEEILRYKKNKTYNKVYRINDNNVNYLLDECEEKEHYKKLPGRYISSIIEEYCSLPFIEREKIYRKPVFDRIEQARKGKKNLKVYDGKTLKFKVCPYKIIPDPLHTRSYLTCYSWKKEQDEKDRIIASFSIARMQLPTIDSSPLHLTAKDINEIEEKIKQVSPAYLLGDSEKIQVKLTKKGKQIYQSKLHLRPEKIKEPSSDNIYTFECTPRQIFNYFFSFGADAEIISPKELRDEFKQKHMEALALYNQSQS